MASCHQEWVMGEGWWHKAESDAAAELTVGDAVFMSGKRHAVCWDKQGSLPHGQCDSSLAVSQALLLLLQGCWKNEIISCHSFLSWSQWFLLSPENFQPQDLHAIAWVNRSTRRSKFFSDFSGEDAYVQLLCVGLPRTRMNDHMEGGRNGNCYISRPGKVADKKEVRSPGLKDRCTNLMTSHLCSILSEVLQKIWTVLKQSLECCSWPQCAKSFPFLFLTDSWVQLCDGGRVGTVIVCPLFYQSTFPDSRACAPSWPKCEWATVFSYLSISHKSQTRRRGYASRAECKRIKEGYNRHTEPCG